MKKDASGWWRRICQNDIILYIMPLFSSILSQKNSWHFICSIILVRLKLLKHIFQKRILLIPKGMRLAFLRKQACKQLSGVIFIIPFIIPFMSCSALLAIRNSRLCVCSFILKVIICKVNDIILIS